MTGSVIPHETLVSGSVQHHQRSLTKQSCVIIDQCNLENEAN